MKNHSGWWKIELLLMCPECLDHIESEMLPEILPEKSFQGEVQCPFCGEIFIAQVERADQLTDRIEVLKKALIDIANADYELNGLACAKNVARRALHDEETT